MPDLPVEESENYRKMAKKYDIDTIFLVAPSTSEQRLSKIIQKSSGFLYLVSQFGVTGTREKLKDSTIKMIKKILPKTKKHIPLAVGFGISKPEHARLLFESGSDGVIVGSAFVKIIEKHQKNPDKIIQKIRKFTNNLKEVLKTK